MITSFFRKSTPINYTAIILGLLFLFFYYQLKHATADNSLYNIILKCVLLVVLFASFFLTNFILKKNGLSKDSAYGVFFFLLFLMFFPGILNNTPLLLSNFFVLLAMRRIISLKSLKASKEKIFDASLWVFIACLFHFWSILYIALIFVAILFHVARDYRNWFLPILAFFTIAILFVGSAIFLNKQWIESLLANSVIDLRLHYFVNNYQNIAFSIYATIGLFFLVVLLLTLSNRPLILHPTYKKVISALVIGSVVFAVSPNKSNDLLVYTFAPLAMITTTYFETAQAYWKREVVLWILLSAALFSFITQS